MTTRKYTVSELKKIIAENATEFKQVLGKDVEKDNKKNNEKAYKDIANETENYDGGVRDSKKLAYSYPNDDNKGMQDIEYTNMNDMFKKRVQSQMKGYASADAEAKHKNDDFGNADFTEIKNMKERHEAMSDAKKKAKEIGLTSREIDKKEFDKQQKSVFENKICTLKFKNTVFLTEQHMLARVPDDFKVSGKKFIMKDKNNHEYLVEWSENNPTVICTTKINEQKNRIHELFQYKSNVVKSTCEKRMNENIQLNDMLEKVRSLMK